MAADYRDLVERTFDAFNRNAIGELTGLFTPDFVEHEELPGVAAEGIEAVTAWLGMMRTAFPDLRFELVELVSQGDLAGIRARITGTHQGEFMGIPATGRPIDIETFDFVRVADGRCAEHWGATQETEMMTQLGVMPEATIDLTKQAAAVKP